MLGTIAQAVFLSIVLCAGALAADPPTISQKGKTFSPDQVEIAVGGSVIIDNDDRTIHHVYIESSEFNFDSGEQVPGHKVRITFPKTGTFEVKCDIHPKMLLRVVVK